MSRRQAQGEETPERRLWAQAIDWIVVLFRALKRWPGREALELSGHLRVVAVSAAAQITRAWLRPPARAGSPHLERARQDLTEAETLLVVARRLGYLTRRQAAKLTAGALALRMGLDERLWPRTPRTPRRRPPRR